jgi:hypothetical protein
MVVSSNRDAVISSEYLSDVGRSVDIDRPAARSRTTQLNNRTMRRNLAPGKRCAVLSMGRLALVLTLAVWIGQVTDAVAQSPEPARNRLVSTAEPVSKDYSRHRLEDPEEFCSSRNRHSQYAIELDSGAEEGAAASVFPPSTGLASALELDTVGQSAKAHWARLYRTMPNQRHSTVENGTTLFRYFPSQAIPVGLSTPESVPVQAVGRDVVQDDTVLDKWWFWGGIFIGSALVVSGTWAAIDGLNSQESQSSDGKAIISW